MSDSGGVGTYVREMDCANEIERLEKENRSLKRLAGRHEAAWDTLDYLCDYDAGSPDYTKGLAWVRRKIAELRPGAEESNG